jgi:hypothetical protein
MAVREGLQASAPGEVDGLKTEVDLGLAMVQALVRRGDLGSAIRLTEELQKTAVHRLAEAPMRPIVRRRVVVAASAAAALVLFRRRRAVQAPDAERRTGAAGRGSDRRDASRAAQAEGRRARGCADAHDGLDAGRDARGNRGAHAGADGRRAVAAAVPAALADGARAAAAARSVPDGARAVRRPRRVAVVVRIAPRRPG